MGSLLGSSVVWFLVFNLLSCCRCMFALSMSAISMELGILGVTLSSLLSELHHPHLSMSKKGSAYQRKRQEVVATSVSIVASGITFGMTILGSGDFLLGVRIVGRRMSAAGRAAFGMPLNVGNVSHRQLSSRHCCPEVEDNNLEHETGSEAMHDNVQLPLAAASLALLAAT
jgi:hypothetical protein